MAGEIKTIAHAFQAARLKSVEICKPLAPEDYVVQPVIDVSPPKWHLGHTTWFFETFVLKEFAPDYQVFHKDFHYVFNSYYETLGARVLRTDRGNLSRPGINEVLEYRAHVDAAMMKLLEEVSTPNIQEIVTLGIQHEQQHQELLLTDIKYILGHNPLFPAYDQRFSEYTIQPSGEQHFHKVTEGIYEIGFHGDGFHFDNERERHKVYLNDFQISTQLVTHADWLEFIEAGVYQDFRYWLSEGWDWVKTHRVEAPLYWYFIDQEWKQYTLAGLSSLILNEPIKHISFFEAEAFARWKGMRLPTEAEWEVSQAYFSWGKRWEWTQSAYLPYPGFKAPEGAVGEYNGKFMINQMVLRGSSIATAAGHSRPSYRNFFHPHLRWQFTGLRLAK